MSLLSALLAGSNNGRVLTRPALLVLDVQNDFVSPLGKLPVDTGTGFLERIVKLVPQFREHGDVIWVRSEYTEPRAVSSGSSAMTSRRCSVVLDDDNRGRGGRSKSVGAGTTTAASPEESPESWAVPSSGPSYRTARGTNTLVKRAMKSATELGIESMVEAVPTSPQAPDPELFLSQLRAEQCCGIPGSIGADYSHHIVHLIRDRDVQIVKSHYSALTATALLSTLRSRFVNKVYIVGCLTNISIYATAVDIARFGMEINLVSDCLGYARRERHDLALGRMVDALGVSTTSAASTITSLLGSDDGRENNAANDDDREDKADSDFDATDLTVDSLEFQDAEEEVQRLSPSRSPHLGTFARKVGDLCVRHVPSARSIGVELDKSTSHEEKGYVGGIEQIGPWPSPPRAVDSHDDLRSKADPPPPAAGGTVQRVRQQTSLSSLSTFASTRSPRLPYRQSPAMRQKSPESPQTLPLPLPLPYTHTTPTRILQPQTTRKKPAKSTPPPSLGPGDRIGAGESRLIPDLLPGSCSDTIFAQLLHEVPWQTMHHAAGEVPRLVCCQGDVDFSDGSAPVYRHPSDQALPLLHWTAGVARIRREAEKKVGHGLNHVLVQLYRNGQDYISEHSDKTLDISPRSTIVNVSIGAERTMRLRGKRAAAEVTGTGTDSPRPVQRVALPHNSIFVMGLATNAVWLHGINADKRLATERSPAELAYGGMRISLTFRHIATFLSSDSRLIWGQGASAKEKSRARPTVNGREDESQKMIDAFGTENQSTEFDWPRVYGGGFDVLHLKTRLPEREKPMLFLSGHRHQDLSVRLYLAQCGIETAIINPPTLPGRDTRELKDANGSNLPNRPAHRRQILFRDTDTLHTLVEGETAILLYLDRCYARFLTAETPASLASTARELALLTGSALGQLEMVREEGCREWLRRLDDWLRDRGDVRGLGSGGGGSRNSSREAWIAGAEFTAADCAIWPRVHRAREIVEGFVDEFAALNGWLIAVEQRRAVVEVVAALDGRG